MALIILVVDEAEMRYNTMCPPSEIDPTTYHTMSDCNTIDLLLAKKKTTTTEQQQPKIINK